MLSSEQARMARALLKLDQKETADAAGISVPTLKRWENGSGPLTGAYDKVTGLRQFYERQGVEFIAEGQAGEGVRFKLPRSQRTPIDAAP